jgi:hypothetical protein
MKTTIEEAAVCAKGEQLTYDAARGGYTCGGCRRHFAMRSINTHIFAARRRVFHASVRVDRSAS